MLPMALVLEEDMDSVGLCYQLGVHSTFILAARSMGNVESKQGWREYNINATALWMAPWFKVGSIVYRTRMNLYHQRSVALWPRVCPHM